MNVLTPAAQIAAHDIASGAKGSLRPQQTPRRLNIADLAELATRPVQPAAASNPSAPSAAAPQDLRPAESDRTPASRGDGRPVRPGTRLDIRV
jgi:hypothetical protein